MPIIFFIKWIKKLIIHERNSYFVQFVENNVKAEIIVLLVVQVILVLILFKIIIYILGFLIW